ncbi:unnamed protein product [Spirodela intermedia]|uniref:Uncharacterized protein n=1 Tax=Spirodela intermedia TaxID=51605 RepID=A0A7I8L6I0_SPIIN|nr:unnamed protein product [Spirodela intermedia]
MEYFPAGFGTFGQLYPESVPRNISSIGHLLNRYVHKTEEVVCPEPRRIIGKPIVPESLNRICSKPRSLLAQQRGEAPEILDIILSSSDDADGDLGSPRQLGFLCGSPPLRTSNPLILDAKFEEVAAPDALPHGCRPLAVAARMDRAVLPLSPLGNSHGAKPPMGVAGQGGPQPKAVNAERELPPPSLGGGDSRLEVVKVERPSPSCKGKPRVRIEGFAPASSESGCVVTALA